MLANAAPLPGRRLASPPSMRRLLASVAGMVGSALTGFAEGEELIPHFRVLARGQKSPVYVIDGEDDGLGLGDVIMRLGGVAGGEVDPDALAAMVVRRLETEGAVLLGDVTVDRVNLTRREALAHSPTAG